MLRGGGDASASESALARSSRSARSRHSSPTSAADTGASSRAGSPAHSGSQSQALADCLEVSLDAVQMSPPPPGLEERLEPFAMVIGIVRDVYGGDSKRVRTWLRTTRPELDGRRRSTRSASRPASIASSSSCSARGCATRTSGVIVRALLVSAGWRSPRPRPRGRTGARRRTWTSRTGRSSARRRCPASRSGSLAPSRATLRRPRSRRRRVPAGAMPRAHASRCRIAPPPPWAAPLPASGGRTNYTICEDRIGAATATIVAFGEGTNAFVIHARIRWPDGESLDVRADATDRAYLEQLLAAVRTIRRAGA